MKALSAERCDHHGPQGYTALLSNEERGRGSSSSTAPAPQKTRCARYHQTPPPDRAHCWCFTHQRW
jgi:hypothetical protein